MNPYFIPLAIALILLFILPLPLSVLLFIVQLISARRPVFVFKDYSEVDAFKNDFGEFLERSRKTRKIDTYKIGPDFIYFNRTDIGSTLNIKMSNYGDYKIVHRLNVPRSMKAGGVFIGHFVLGIYYAYTFAYHFYRDHALGKRVVEDFKRERKKKS